MEVKKSSKIFLPNNQRSIKLYSSNENILFFQGKYKQNIMIIPNVRFEA